MARNLSNFNIVRREYNIDAYKFAK